MTGEVPVIDSDRRSAMAAHIAELFPLFRSKSWFARIRSRD